MRLSLLAMPIALLAALVLVDTPTAEASPIATTTARAALGGGVFVGGSVHVPVRSRRVVSRRYVTGGRYVLKPVRVKRVIPGEPILDDYGHQLFDAYGNPAFTASRIVYVTEYRKVWVPHRVRRVVHHRRAHGHVTLGAGFRIR